MQMLVYHMGRCSEVGISSFVKEIQRDVRNRTLPRLFRLEISDVIFTKAAIESLKELLQGQSVLQALHILCYLDPTNASVTVLLKYLIEGLSFNSSCNDIGLGFFDLRDSHVYHLILLVRGCPQLMFFTLTFDVDLRRIMPLFSAALRYTTLRMLNLMRCKIDDRALQYLGIGIRENQHLELLLIMDNYLLVTAKGLLRFLIFLINEKSVFDCVVINGEPFNSLIRRTGYSYIISQINHI